MYWLVWLLVPGFGDALLALLTGLAALLGGLFP